MRTVTTRLPVMLLIVAAIFTQQNPAKAGDFSPYSSPFPIFNEVRLGVFGADLDPGGATDDTIAINGELLTTQIGGPNRGSILESFLHPRLHLGTTINTEENGVNAIYAGFTWGHDLGERLFFETSFGAGAHDGETRANDSDSYGCTVLFRESASVGVHLTERVDLMGTISHMSNANLCDENQGLTNAGVRLGYRW